MLLYLVNVVRAFLPMSLAAGLLFALAASRDGRKTSRAIVVSLLSGLAIGIIAYSVSVRHETITAARVILSSSCIVAAVINGVSLFLDQNSGRAVRIVRSGTAALLATALAASSLFSFMGLMAEHALSAITVLNTELILNLGGILIGFVLIAFFIPLIEHVSKKSGKGIASAFLLFVSALLVVPWSAEVLLGLMRLELTEVTSARLSFIAKVAKYALAAPYVQILMIGVLTSVSFVKRPVLAPDQLFGLRKADRRKARSRALLELRWFKSAIASLCAILAILLSYDLYASRPQRITPPVRLTADDGGLIKIRIDGVKDGKLHRYSSVTDDGHVVRFILINRSKGQNRIGVVYDACMLCGDMGYIQQKNEVICIACNVRVFTPSIGKAGGCNPIPLIHSVDGDSLVISAEELDKGARYFSQVASIRVKDPVTGKELDNLKAPYRYEYKGRTYFFESEKSEEKFKASPETYTGVQQSRYERARGYQE